MEKFMPVCLKEEKNLSSQFLEEDDAWKIAKEHQKSFRHKVDVLTKETSGTKSLAETTIFIPICLNGCGNLAKGFTNEDDAWKSGRAHQKESKHNIIVGTKKE